MIITIIVITMHLTIYPPLFASINMPTSFFFISTPANSLLKISHYASVFSHNLIITAICNTNSTEAMNNYKFKKSQILMLSLLAALLTITPLLSSSLRPTYLYFVINLLIIALGAEAGLLSSAFSKPPQEDKKYPPKPLPATQESSTEAISGTYPRSDQKKVVTTVEKSTSEKISSPVIVDTVKKVKKCPSMPSLFFIGSGEIDAAEEPMSKECLYEEEEEEEFEDGLSGQELFTKAEMFIGNFYKQLKMQREESWKKIHGFYQKAF